MLSFLFLPLFSGSTCGSAHVCRPVVLKYDYLFHLPATVISVIVLKCISTIFYPVAFSLFVSYTDWRLIYDPRDGNVTQGTPGVARNGNEWDFA